MSVAVLISGRGSNLRAIAEYGIPVSLIVSNRRGAPGLRYAKITGAKTEVVEDGDYPDRPSADEAIAKVLRREKPQLIALAGFMRVLGAEFVREFAANTVNIHPSLLPAFPGLQTHKRALSAGAREHGCTVHWLSEEVDQGKIIAQARVPVLPDDDEESLAARVLQAEHKLYPETLHALLKRNPQNAV